MYISYYIKSINKQYNIPIANEMSQENYKISGKLLLECIVIKDGKVKKIKLFMNNPCSSVLKICIILGVSIETVRKKDKSCCRK